MNGRGGFGSVSRGRGPRESRIRGSLSIRGVFIVVLALAILQLAVASAAQAESFYYYGKNNTTCWQIGQPGAPSETCDTVGAKFLNTSNPVRTIEGALNGDLNPTNVPKSGSYCNAYQLNGGQFFNRDENNEGGLTGFTPPTPYGDFQMADNTGDVCQAMGTQWGQGLRPTAQNGYCTGSGHPLCGMQHYVSFISQGGSLRPWSNAFKNPELILEGAAYPGQVNVPGGAVAYLCPILEDVGSEHGLIFEYCFLEWEKSGWANWKGLVNQVVESAPAEGHTMNQLITAFELNTTFSTEIAGSANTYLYGENPWKGPFKAAITKGNLEAAIKAANVKYGTGFSTNVAHYALVGVEHGIETANARELGEKTEGLQLRTEYSSLNKPIVSTAPASSVTSGGATLNGSVNPNAEDTHYYFQYGPTLAYGSTVPAPPGNDAGSGASSVPVSAIATGLQPGTTYHYRIVAENSAGKTVTVDQMFTTLPGVFFSDKSDNNSVSYWSWDSIKGWQQSLLFGHPVAAGTSPTALTINGLPNVFFVDASRGNQITDWIWSPSTGWQQSFLATDPVAAGSSPSGVVVNGVAHVFFSDANNLNSITDLTTASQSWQQVPLFGHAVAKGSSPAALISSGGSAQVFFADAANGNSITAWTQTPSWQQAPFSGDAVAAGSSPSVVVNNGTTNIFFADATKGGTMADWTWSPTSLQLSPFYGHQIAAGTSPSAIVNNGSAQVFFADAADSNTISAWTWSPTSLQQSTLFGDPVATGSSPVARMISGSANIYFADAADNNAISTWKWTSSSLQQTALFGHPVASGSSPSN